MIKYIIPDSDRTREINFFVLELMKRHKEMFYDNIKIDGCYGILANTVWSGGRFDLGGVYTHRSSVKTIVDAYNNYNVRYTYTFSNLFTTPEHLSDPWGNMQLEEGKGKKVGAIVSKDILADYIKEKYPGTVLVSSITRGLLTKQELLKLLKDDRYDIVVTNTHLNNTIEKIVPLELRGKCELLINDCCPGNCPRHQHCYEENSKLAICDPSVDDADLPCKNTAKLSIGNNPSPNALEVFEWLWKFNDNKGFEWVLEKEKQGFQYFKINGRNLEPQDVAYFYSMYFVKKEYQTKFMFLLFSQVQLLRSKHGTLLNLLYSKEVIQ